MEGENKYSFIVIGKTGAGKSSILNSLVGEERFPEGGELTSKTKEVCEYVGKLKYDHSTFAIIDTPGFYDTDNEDNKHINNIVKFMKNLKEFGGINCIFYVVALTEKRFDHTIQTCLSLLRTLLGDDIFKMMKFIYTMKNDLSRNAFVKALDRFKDLPELLKTSGFAVNDNLETFTYDYDEPEDFCRKIIACTKQSPKFYPEVLQHLDNIDFDLNDPVKVYKTLIDNSKCISSLNDQLNKLEEVINTFEQQSQKFEEEKKLFAEELRRKEEEVRKLLEAQKTASEENKKEITKMIQTYSSQIDQLNKGHIDAINQMREANERQNQRMIESQEKYRIEQEKKRLESEERIRNQYEQNQRKYLEEMRISNEQQQKFLIESNEMERRAQETSRLESEERLRQQYDQSQKLMQEELKALRERPPTVIHESSGGGFCTIF